VRCATEEHLLPIGLALEHVIMTRVRVGNLENAELEVVGIFGTFAIKECL